LLLFNMLDATPGRVPRDPCSSYCTSLNRSRCVTLARNPREVGFADPSVQNAAFARDRSDRHNMLDRLAIRSPTPAMPSIS
jgi:hypothetical protein